MEKKEEDIGDVCPVFEAVGKCKEGWACRWLSGHLRKAEEGEEGELDGWVLLVDEAKFEKSVNEELNRVGPEEQKSLRLGQLPLPLSTAYLKRIEEEEQSNGNGANGGRMVQATNGADQDGNKADEKISLQADERATFNEIPLRLTEKRKVLFPF